MNFQQLLSLIDEEEVVDIIEDMYDISDRQLYQRNIEFLKSIETISKPLTSVKLGVAIVVSIYQPVSEGDGLRADVFGFNYDNKQFYSTDYSSMKELLSMEIIDRSFNYLNYQEFCAHVLYHHKFTKLEDNINVIEITDENLSLLNLEDLDFDSLEDLLINEMDATCSEEEMSRNHIYAKWAQTANIEKYEVILDILLEDTSTLYLRNFL